MASHKQKTLGRFKARANVSTAVAIKSKPQKTSGQEVPFHGRTSSKCVSIYSRRFRIWTRQISSSRRQLHSTRKTQEITSWRSSNSRQERWSFLQWTIAKSLSRSAKSHCRSLKSSYQFFFRTPSSRLEQYLKWRWYRLHSVGFYSAKLVKSLI